MGQNFDALTREQQRALRREVSSHYKEYVVEKAAGGRRRISRAELNESITTVCENLAKDKGFVQRVVERGDGGKSRSH